MSLYWIGYVVDRSVSAINGATVNYNDNGSSLSVQWKGGAVRNVDA